MLSFGGSRHVFIIFPLEMFKSQCNSVASRDFSFGEMLLKQLLLVSNIFNLLFHVNPLSMSNGSFQAGNLQLGAYCSLIVCWACQMVIIFLIQLTLKALGLCFFLQCSCLIKY